MRLKNLNALSVIFFIILTTTFSCDEKETENTTIGKVSFSSDDIIEVEGATQPLGINLGIDTYSHIGGTVHVEVTGGNYGSDYILSTGSDSFDLNVAKGSQIASFGVTTINDDAVESNVDLTFTITSVSEGLELGDDAEFKLTILNDDDPSIATINFATTTYQVNEDDVADKTIDIAFNQVSTSGGTIDIVASGNAVYGTDYTVQGQSSGSFTINVPPLATSASFVVNSVDDAAADNNKNVTFTIAAVTGGLQGQSPNATTITLIDNDFVPIPINYVETFEGNTGGTYLTTTLGYAVQTINQSAGITALMSANTSAGAYADVTTVSSTSNNGINLFHNAGSPANSALLGELDQVLISPSFNANGLVTFTLDYNHGFTAQNNAVVTFYWSETYTSGAFNPAQWTVLGTDTAANMIANGFAVNVYKRRQLQFSPQNSFRIAIKVTQTIDATFYRSRWRFDNFKLTN